MKNNAKKLLALLLAAALLLPAGLLAAAKNGPMPIEEGEEWAYARLELAELDADGAPVMVDMGEWEEQKTLPLYEKGKAVAREGAVYDPDANTLTLNDFNGGGYLLRVNLMGDDFKIDVRGECTLAGITVNGGGVMQPKWGGSLRIAGDGALTVNPDKTQESGVSFWPQEEERTSFTVDDGVTLAVFGKKTAVSVSSYTGEFSMRVGGQDVEVKKETAVRTLSVNLPGYSNPWKENIHLCRSAADPEGLYGMNEWFDMDDHPVSVTVDRYIHVASPDLYLQDYRWELKENGDSGRTFDTLEEANAAGFTYLLDGEGNDQWLQVDSMGNHYEHSVYEDADGNRYAVENSYDDAREYRRIAMTIQPIDEIPGEYLFLYAPDVDPDTLTEVEEDTEIEGMYDYSYPSAELKAEPVKEEKLTVSRIDLQLDETRIPWGEAITPEAMFELLADGLFTLETPGVYMIVRRVEEQGTRRYQTLPITASRLFSDSPFDAFGDENEYEFIITFGSAFDQAAGKMTVFDPNGVSLYVNGEKTDEAEPLKEDVDEMVVAGNVTLSAGVYAKPAAFLLGDVNGDGEVKADDARLALRAAVQLDDIAEGFDFSDPQNRCYRAADVDGEEGIGAADARLILRAAVGLETLG